MRNGLHLDEATVRKNGFEVGSNPAKLGAISINVSVQSLSHTKQAGMPIGLHQIWLKIKPWETTVGLVKPCPALLEASRRGYLTRFAKPAGGVIRLASSTLAASALHGRKTNANILWSKLSGEKIMIRKHRGYCIHRSPSQCRPCMVAAVGAIYHAEAQNETMARRLPPNLSGVEEALPLTRWEQHQLQSNSGTWSIHNRLCLRSTEGTIQEDGRLGLRQSSLLSLSFGQISGERENKTGIVGRLEVGRRSFRTGSWVMTIKYVVMKVKISGDFEVARFDTEEKAVEKIESLVSADVKAPVEFYIRKTWTNK